MTSESELNGLSPFLMAVYLTVEKMVRVLPDEYQAEDFLASVEATLQSLIDQQDQLQMEDGAEELG